MKKNAKRGGPVSKIVMAALVLASTAGFVSGLTRTSSDGGESSGWSFVSEMFAHALPGQLITAFVDSDSPSPRPTSTARNFSPARSPERSAAASRTPAIDSAAKNTFGVDANGTPIGDLNSVSVVSATTGPLSPTTADTVLQPISRGTIGDSGGGPVGPNAPETARTWNSLGTDWNTTANWTGGAPTVANAVGVFTTVESVQPNLSASVSIAGILFQGTGTFNYDITRTGGAVFTLNGTDATGAGGTSNGTAAPLRGENTSGTNTIDVPITLGAAAAATQVFFQAAGGTLIVNGVLTNTNAITLDLKGTGIIQLNGANTALTAAVRINDAGTTLQVGNDNALGTGSFTFSSSGTIQAGGSRTIPNNVFFASGTPTIGGSNDITFTGNLTNSGAANRTITVNNSGVTTVSGNLFLAGDDITARADTINGTGAITISGVVANNNAGNTVASTLTYSGSNTLTLSGTNTYTGNTTVSGGGTISVSSIGNSGASGNVGAGTTINLGATTTTGTLRYTGTGETTSKIINLNGSTGGATIDQSGTGLLKFTGANTATGNGLKTLTLQGSTAGSGEITGAIVNSTSATSLTKTGTGTWTLSGNNTFTGTTTVNGGTLEANATAGNKALGGSTNIIVNTGGTLLTSSAQQFNAGTPPTMTLAGGTFNTAGTSQTLGVLTLSSSSIIDLASSASILAFANSSGAIWSGTLSILNWTGTLVAGGGTDQLIFGSNITSLTAGQLLEIQFVDPAGLAAGTYGAVFATSANGEIVPGAPVPEPSTWIGGALALAAIAFTQRKRLAKRFRVIS